MAVPAQINSYLNTQYEGMSPEQLILMLFKGALDRLKLVKQGIQENDIKKRGENLSKVIAIISELNSSVDSKMNDESTQFLRGLYSAILVELPKVSINNDIKIVTRTELYVTKLKEIWETDVIGAKKGIQDTGKKSIAKPFSGGYSQPNRSSLGSISV